MRTPQPHNLSQSHPLVGEKEFSTSMPAPPGRTSTTELREGLFTLLDARAKADRRPRVPWNAPDGVNGPPSAVTRRSTVVTSNGSRRGCQSRGQYGVDNAILSRRPRCHDQDAGWSVEVPRGASAGKVAVIGRELRAEWRRTHGTAVELQEESVDTLPQTQYPYPSGLKRPWAQAAALRHSTNAPSRCERAARASTPKTASAPTVWSRWAKRLRRVPMGDSGPPPTRP